ncbi:MAG: hypothetical protein KF866_02330 [Phycisphaeraceae bacterium]|nr:hypothetical protein [Phycisphaeraceae bacterium]MCW5753469.1 hypothetical protein [Phycisphaeraceae bacterium]
MPLGRKLCESLHLIALGLWLGVLVMAGAVAAQVFPVVKALDPLLPEFAAYTGEHWLIAAGHIGEFTFLTADFIQFGCIVLAVLTLVASIMAFGLPLARLTTLVRAGVVGIGLAIVAYQIFILAPEMNQNLRQYWTAARQGDLELATRFRDAFLARHPESRNVLAACTLCAASGIVAAVWSITAPSGIAQQSSPYATPALKKGLA